MSRWTPEQVRSAAPDEASIKAARSLAKPGPWSETGATDTLVWGKCQGSGSTPYQVSIDLVAPAYRCSCPSRKFPCKHALALLLLWSEGTDIAAVGEPAAFADAWAQDRAQRAARAAATTATRAADPATVDPQAQAKRRETRLATMDAGLADFAVWLRDLTRGGLAAARSGPVTNVENAASRLVDAQCPTLAADVRDLPALLVGDDWIDGAMAALGRWWTIVQAWQRRDTLSDDAVADLRVALGWSWSTDEISARPHVSDQWLVLGATRDDRGRLAEQRTWLRGVESDSTVLLLDFAVAGQPLPIPRVTGAVLQATVAAYPGTPPHRAVLIDEPAPAPAAPLPAGLDLTEAADTIARHLAANPVAPRTPLLLAEVTVTATHVVDAAGAALPLAGGIPNAVLAATGGHPSGCFGEWSSAGFTPLTVFVDDVAVPCG